MFRRSSEEIEINERFRALPAYARLEHARRMAIVSGCVERTRELGYAHRTCRDQLEAFQKSKLVPIGTAVALVALLAGAYLWTWLYIVAIWSFGSVAIRYAEVWSTERKLQQVTSDLGTVRLLWLTSGQSGSTFEDLLGQACQEGGLDLESKKYAAWWYRANADCELAVGMIVNPAAMA